jgi:hypothetical protein
MIDLVGEYCASLRRMPLSAAQELHSTFGIPWPSITATCPVPTRARFADKARSLYEPDEDGGAGWVIPATCVDPARPEEIEAVDPLDIVSTGPIVDLVAFHPHCRDRFALRIGHAVVLGAVEPQHLEPARVPVWGDIGDWLRAGCSGLVVRGFRGTRHHGLAPGRKAKPIIKESCSPALGHGPGHVPRGEVAAASQ